MSSDPTALNESRQQIRGSSLLLVGRFASLLLNLITQVLTVRYLIKADFGAFAFAVAMEELTANFAMLGLNRACSRFVPIFHERRDIGRTLGTLVMTVLTVAAMGTAIALIIVGSQSLLAGYIDSDGPALTLLLMLVVLIPIGAVDLILESFFAAFGSVGVVFFRRHVLAPGLKLAAAATVVLCHGSVFTLAYGYLAAGTAGFLFCTIPLYHLLHRQGLWNSFRWSRLTFPVREFWQFSGPLLATHLGFLLQDMLVILLLQILCGALAVAEFRAVLPFARLNIVVLGSFTLLYMPVTARFLARDEHHRIGAAYWEAVAWVTMLTFPLFIVTSVFARPLTVFILGEQYAGATGIMAILATGLFIEAVFGLSGHTLRVYARIRDLMVADGAAIITGVVLFVVLIPGFGALGAAIAVTASRVLQFFLYAVLTGNATDVKPLERAGLKIYASVALAIVVLAGVEVWVRPDLEVAILLSGVVWLALLMVNRRVLAIGRVYPELARVPVLGGFLAGRAATLRHAAEMPQQSPGGESVVTLAQECSEPV